MKFTLSVVEGSTASISARNHFRFFQKGATVAPFFMPHSEYRSGYHTLVILGNRFTADSETVMPLPMVTPTLEQAKANVRTLFRTVAASHILSGISAQTAYSIHSEIALMGIPDDVEDFNARVRAILNEVIDAIAR